MKPTKSDMDQSRLERVVADARKQREERERGYRERALKLFPWVCARCGREFTRSNVQELTVHHKDHDHDRNPPDGSNWELLCMYCHDNEHQRHLESLRQAGISVGRDERSAGATQRPFANLRDLLEDK
jgi:predicted HNH restriction endonuclease